jgi:hypothetical protein
MRIRRLHRFVAFACIVALLASMPMTVCAQGGAIDPLGVEYFKLFRGAWAKAHTGDTTWDKLADQNDDGVLDASDAVAMLEGLYNRPATSGQSCVVDTAALHADPATTQVLSAWQDATTVDADGQAPTTVSQDGAQLVVASDGKLRGLAVAIPGVSPTADSPLEIGRASCRERV